MTNERDIIQQANFGLPHGQLEDLRSLAWILTQAGNKTTMTDLVREGITLVLRKYRKGAK